MSAPDDALRVDCPGCKCPDQPIGLACGFCGTTIPAPSKVLTRDYIDDGFKGLNVKGAGASIRLWSPSFPTLWEPHEWLIAECHWAWASTLTPAHPSYHGPDALTPEMVSPAASCQPGGHGCGIYCARGRNHLLSSLREYTGSVIARVELAGKIIVASNGYRAQKMRPVEILVPHEQWKVARDLKAVYGGPYADGTECIVKTAATQLAAADLKWCEKCRAKMKGRTTVCSWCGHTHK